MPLIISNQIRTKLSDKHNVTESEILQCFANMGNPADVLIDDREDHKTDPPTEWFIGKTDLQRILKVVYVNRNGNIFIKTTYEADRMSQYIYHKFYPHN